MKKYALILALSVLLLFTGCARKQDVVNHDTQEKKVVVNKKKEIPTNNVKTDVSKDTKKPSNVVVKPETINTPVVIEGYFVGGLIKGKWVSPEEFYNKKVVNMKNIQYSVFNDDKNIGIAKGSAPINPRNGEELKTEKYDSEYCFVNLMDKDNKLVNFFDKSNREVNYDIALKADWNIFPRPYVKQSTSIPTYENIVKNALKKEGIKDPKTTIRQVIRVDLNGDGIEEVIITADNTKNQKFEQVKKGDNAIVIFRSYKNGVVNEQIVEKNLIKEKREEPDIFRYLFKVQSVADLDGDGTMEVIINDWYYEGNGYIVYKFKNNRLEVVGQNGFGA